jgi:hypothetical protein
VRARARVRVKVRVRVVGPFHSISSTMILNSLFVHVYIHINRYLQQMVIKAMKYQSALKEKPGSLPFEKTISCNIGNPQVRG